MIVPELVKPSNNVLLMWMLANVLGIPEASKRNHNLDDEFLMRPVQLVVGAIDWQVETMDMQKEELKNTFYHPRPQLLQPKAGLNMSFHGCLGASEDDFLCPLIKYRPSVNLEFEQSLSEADCHLTDTD